MSNIDKNSLIGLGPNSKKIREYKESLFTLNVKQQNLKLQ